MGECKADCGEREAVGTCGSRTFTHVTDALLEDVVAVAIHVGAQEVLKAVVDLQAWACHAHPLTHGVALEVLQVLNALDHVFVLLAVLRGPLYLAAFPGGALLVLLITVWGPNRYPHVKFSHHLPPAFPRIPFQPPEALEARTSLTPSEVQTSEPTVQESAAHAAQAPTGLSVTLPHGPFCCLSLTGCQLLDVLIVQGQALGLVDIQFRDGTIVPEGAPKWTLLVSKTKQKPAQELGLLQKTQEPQPGQAGRVSRLEIQKALRESPTETKRGLCIQWSIIQSAKGRKSDRLQWG